MDLTAYLGPALRIVAIVAAVCRTMLDRAEARQAMSWPAVEGTVVGGHAQQWRQGKGNIVRWYARMEFYFEAEGAYYGNRFAIRLDSEEAADQVVRDNNGKPLAVRYKPGDPDTARAVPYGAA